MPRAKPRKCPDVSSEDEETILEWPFLGQLIRKHREKDVVEWVTNKSIVGVLTDFKRSEIDHPERYEQLRRWLGPEGELWDKITESGLKPRKKNAQVYEHAELIKRISLTIKRLVEVAEVPGVKEYEQGGATCRAWCKRGARFLLLTVLKDLQDHPEPGSYWMKRLGGARVTPWEQESALEELARPIGPTQPAAHRKGVSKPIPQKKSSNTITSARAAVLEQVLELQAETPESSVGTISSEPPPAYDGHQFTTPAYHKRFEKEQEDESAAVEDPLRVTQKTFFGKTLRQRAEDDWGAPEDYSFEHTAPSSGSTSPDYSKQLYDNQTRGSGPKEKTLAPYGSLGEKHAQDESIRGLRSDRPTYSAARNSARIPLQGHPVDSSDSEDGPITGPAQAESVVASIESDRQENATQDKGDRILYEDSSSLFVTPNASREASPELSSPTYDELPGVNHSTGMWARCTGYNGPGGAARYEKLKVDLKASREDYKLKEREHSACLRELRKSQRETKAAKDDLQEEREINMRFTEDQNKTIEELRARILKLEESETIPF